MTLKKYVDTNVFISIKRIIGVENALIRKLQIVLKSVGPGVVF